MLGYEPQQMTIIIVMYALVDEQIKGWNVVKKQDVEFK
jgi:hypothetical protein